MIRARKSREKKKHKRDQEMLEKESEKERLNGKGPPILKLGSTFAFYESAFFVPSFIDMDNLVSQIQ